jgi:hypothetical protein
MGFALGGSFVWSSLQSLPPPYDITYKEPAEDKTKTEPNKVTPTKEVEDRLATYTLWLAIFTAVLAGSTIGLWIVTFLGSRKQSRDMEAVVAAALAANEISQQTLVSDRRAWVAVSDPKIHQDVFFGIFGAMFDVSVKITNFGKTPAISAHTTMEMIEGYAGSAEAVRELAARAKTEETYWSRIIFPDESYRREWSLNVSRPTPPQISVSPIVIGCVTY